MKKRIIIGTAITAGIAAAGFVGCVLYVGRAFQHLKFANLDEEV